MTAGKVLPYWLEESYYQQSKAGSEDRKHRGMQMLYDTSRKASSVVDLGCGEGTRLFGLVNSRKIKALGIDISPKAIEIARRQYPQIKFLCADLEELKLNEKFDVVYSAFVLEHLTHPEKLINQAIDIISKNGLIFLMCPNFGSPNRRSPNSEEGKFNKLVVGFIDDLIKIKKPANQLNWKIVAPKFKSFTQIDDDTTCEPYLLSLIRYLKGKKINPLFVSSLWELEPWSFNPRKLLLKLLGKLGIYPFKYWGPQVLVVIKR